MANILVAMGLLVAACGGTATDQATSTAPPATSATAAPTTAAPSTTASSTTTPSTTTSTTTASPSSTTTGTTAPPVESLDSYRFVLTVGLTDDPGRGDVRPLYELAGEATDTPRAMRVYGVLGDSQVDLVTDGTRWWDLEEPELELTAADAEFYLGANAFILPDRVAVLLIEEEAWIPAGSEVIRGVPTTRAQRLDMTNGLDWELGGLALLEVWRDELGQMVKFTAWYATGDNAGWPVMTFEITERNPELEIPIPG